MLPKINQQIDVKKYENQYKNHIKNDDNFDEKSMRNQWFSLTCKTLILATRPERKRDFKGCWGTRNPWNNMKN